MALLGPVDTVREHRPSTIVRDGHAEFIEPLRAAGRHLVDAIGAASGAPINSRAERSIVARNMTVLDQRGEQRDAKLSSKVVVTSTRRPQRARACAVPQ